MNQSIFSYQIVVPATAIDEMGHVNNVVYLQWVQDAAQNHWKQNGGDIIDQYAWVALEHHIQYKAAAKEGDILEIKTYVSQFSGVKSERKTVIKRVKDNKAITTAVTQWCLLKMPEAKPLRVPQELIDLFL